MRSLFGKVLLWWWGTLFLFTIGSALVSALSMRLSEQRFPFTRLITFQLQEARNAYETDGPQGLRAFLDRLQKVYRGPAFLTDANGRDLVTSQDRSALIESASERRLYSIFRRRSFLYTRTSDDGRYRLFLTVPRAALAAWFLLPEHWLVLGAGILLCYWLAYQLTTPVRQLQRAVERFGRGDLAARAGSTRRDELGDLARTFDLMADRIQTLLAAERRLLLDISHELRSPLARLGVAVELARSGDNREAALDRIQKESERLNTLVGGLLQVTRVEGDPGSRRIDPVRLDLLIQELVEDSSIEAGARGCSIELRGAAPCTVKGDPELLRRAIENVLRNAIRYAPAGSKVEVGLEGGGGSAVIRIRDYGPGVPAEALPRIFDAFYRVERDRGRASGGVGLGLSIARRAVELHRGRLRAENAGPGLAVEIELFAEDRCGPGTSGPQNIEAPKS
jgi:signal transduction histidine kinase